MYCKNCGNEVNDGENFCRECGTRANEVYRGNTIETKKKIKNPFIIGIMLLIIFIFAMSMVKVLFNFHESITLEDGANNTVEIPTKKDTKTYYNFIDTTYYTFNFTESEIINRIMQGKSYTSQGFEKKQATIPNRNNYSKVQYSDIQIIGVTTNPFNNKVTSLSMNLYGNYTQDEIYKYSENILINMIKWILNIDSEEQAATEGSELLFDLTNNVSKNKGLVFECNFEKISDSMNSCTITMTVEK